MKISWSISYWSCVHLLVTLVDPGGNSLETPGWGVMNHRNHIIPLLKRLSCSTADTFRAVMLTAQCSCCYLELCRLKNVLCTPWVNLQSPPHEGDDIILTQETKKLSPRLGRDQSLRSRAGAHALSLVPSSRFLPHSPPDPEPAKANISVF